MDDPNKTPRHRVRGVSAFACGRLPPAATVVGMYEDDALRALRNAVRTDETLDVGELWRSGLRAIQRDLEGMLEED